METSTSKKVLSWVRQKINLNRPSNDRQNTQKNLEEEEHNLRRAKQLQALCKAVKANDIYDLRHILCAMVLSECVYKRDRAVMMEAVNTFKQDFGGELVNLKRVQPSLGHVPHRYLLAESGDTLFVSFIGTQQYRDYITNANIFQGAVFHDDTSEDNFQREESELSEESQLATASNKKGTSYKGGQLESNSDKSILQTKELEGGFTPAAHRGFLARAKGIPAVELYRLAQKRGLKLVLCGHSMGGAVAVLATLAILRAFPSASLLKDRNAILVKCITFAQPPVGNAALRDYVHRNDWQWHFRTYCVSEDIVPRILSPAYFQHYVRQFPEDDSQDSIFNSSSTNAANGSYLEGGRLQKHKQTESESLVLGVGPVQNSFQRLYRLVPILGVPRKLDWLRGRKKETDNSEVEISDSTSKEASSPVVQSLEIQEGADGVSIRQLPHADKSSFVKNESAGSKEPRSREPVQWNRVPSFPKYVPFGQLHLLAKSSVEPLSASEYTSLTLVKSVLTELRERLQSHSMKSYRSRFNKICEISVSDKHIEALCMEYLPQPHNLQHWHQLTDTGAVEIRNIAETHIIRTAVSIVPFGWNGILNEENGSEPLRVDVHGYGLHMCTLVQAEVGGIWCSTTVETLPTPPLSAHQAQQTLQKLRIRIGAPLKQIPTRQQNAEGFMNHVVNPAKVRSSLQYETNDETVQPKDLTEVVIHCSSDFAMTSKQVHMRIRRVRLLGLEGAGKTSLYYALLGKPRETTNFTYESILPDTYWQEGVAGGISFIDPAGVNLQDLPGEVTRLKHELSIGLGQLNKKIDLVVLVHNLAHKIPFMHHTLSANNPCPALSLLMDEVGAAGVPWVLAITNKYAVSADQRKSAPNAIVGTYQVPSNMFAIVNSCTYAVHGTSIDSRASSTSEINSKDHIGNNKIQEAAQRLFSAPMNLVQMPFRKREIILPVEGVNSLWKIICQVLRRHEEFAFQELAKERLLIEEEKDKMMAAVANNSEDTAVSATVGAALGAGLGLVVAIIMGAASAFRRH